jgi:hypothetical protein
VDGSCEHGNEPLGSWVVAQLAASQECFFFPPSALQAN